MENMIISSKQNDPPRHAHGLTFPSTNNDNISNSRKLPHSHSIDHDKLDPSVVGSGTNMDIEVNNKKGKNIKATNLSSSCVSSRDLKNIKIASTSEVSCINAKSSNNEVSRSISQSTNAMRLERPCCVGVTKDEEKKIEYDTFCHHSKNDNAVQQTYEDREQEQNDYRDFAQVSSNDNTRVKKDVHSQSHVDSNRLINEEIPEKETEVNVQDKAQNTGSQKQDEKQIRFETPPHDKDHIQGKLQSFIDNSKRKKIRNLEDARHQTLFDNLDRAIETSLHHHQYERKLYSCESLENLTKMCFAAMAIVFSSSLPPLPSNENSSSNDSTNSQSDEGADLENDDYDDGIQNRMNSSIHSNGAIRSKGTSHNTTRSKSRYGYKQQQERQQKHQLHHIRHYDKHEYNKHTCTSGDYDYDDYSSGCSSISLHQQRLGMRGDNTYKRNKSSSTLLEEWQRGMHTGGEAKSNYQYDNKEKEGNLCNGSPVECPYPIDDHSRNRSLSTDTESTKGSTQSEDDDYLYRGVGDDDDDDEDHDDFYDPTTEGHRPSVPLSVITMLWKKILRSRMFGYHQKNLFGEEFDIDKDDNDIFDKSVAVDKDDKPKNKEKSMDEERIIDAILEDVRSALINDLAFLDVITHMDDHDMSDIYIVSSSVGDADVAFPSVHLSNHMKTVTPALEIDPSVNNMHVIKNDSLVNELTYLKINHDVHLLYGHYIARNYPELFSLPPFSAINNTLHSPNTPAVTPPNSRHLQTLCSGERGNWDPEVALNESMAAACLECIQSCGSDDCINEPKWCTARLNQHKSSPSSLPSSNFSISSIHAKIQYNYAIEMLPWHLMRSSQYEDAIDILTDASFVKDRLVALGILGAANIQIADVEEMHDRITSLSEAHSDGAEVEDVELDTNHVFAASYRLISSILHCENVKGRKGNNEILNYEEGFVETVESEQDSHFSSLDKDIVTALALHGLGNSLLSHGFHPDAIKFFSRALIRFEKAYSILTRQEMIPILDVREGSYKRSSVHIDQLQFFMAETLHGIAFIHESMISTSSPSKSNDGEAMLFYERALSFYSRQRSNRHMKGVAKTLTSMGILHYNMKEWESSFSCFDEAISLWRNLHEDDSRADKIGDLLQWMGNVRREMGMPHKALEFFTAALYDKVVMKGKSHPDVGLIHQSLGIVYDDMSKFKKSLEHYDEALRIRRVMLKSAWSQYNLSKYHYAGEISMEKIVNEEMAVAETLQCIGSVYQANHDNENAFNCFLDNVTIHRSHVLALAGDGIMMMDDLAKLMKQGPNGLAAISFLYDSLKLALPIGLAILPIAENEIDIYAERLIDLEEQMADILYDLGMIHGAQYLHDIEDKIIDECAINKEVETERFKAKRNLEDSLTMRKTRMATVSKAFGNFNNYREDCEQVAIAFTLYELGYLFAASVLKKNRDQLETKRGSVSEAKKITLKECAAAVEYFQEARTIMQKSIDLADTAAVDDRTVQEDPLLARFQKMPNIFEKMLQMMAIMYRKMDEYDKAVECYNEVSILLTRMELGEDNESVTKESKVQSQKEKVAFSSHSIGDILFDIGEYSRALESYNEALQLRRLSEKDSLEVADTLCCKGAALLKMKDWDEAVLCYDEALRIRVDRLSQGHRDIAECFYKIGKAYEGDEKLDQALEYLKKAQRIVSGNVNATDTDAADLYFDLGSVVLVKEKAAENLKSTPPSEEDISLALTCLALSRDIYRRKFGDNALEVANTRSLLGVIYAKYSEYDKAISSYEEALRVYRDAPLDQSLPIAKTLNLLGHAYIQGFEACEDDKIIQYFELSLQIFEDEEKYDIEDYAEALFNKGTAHANLDEMDQALVSYEDSLLAYKRVLGKDHIKVSVVLEKIGSCLVRMREHKEALEHFEDALQIRKKYQRDKDLETAEIHFGIGIIYCESGKFNEALDCYEEAISIRREELGDDNVEVAQILNNIGSVFARNGEYQRALLPWEHAIQIYRNAGLEDDHAKVACTLGNIEISMNLVSLSGRKGQQSTIRKIDMY